MFRYQVTTKICESDIDNRFLKDNDRIVFVLRSVGFSAIHILKWVKSYTIFFFVDIP